MYHLNSKRVLSVILSILMILGSVSGVFAASNNDLITNIHETNIGIDKKTLEEKFPLSNAYLNSEIGTAIDKSEHIYVIQFKDGYEEECLNKLNEIPGLEIKYHYDTIFKGVSVKLRADKISQVRDMEGVKNIQENGTFVPQMASAKQITKIKEAVDYYDDFLSTLPEAERKAKKLDGRGTIVAVIDSGIDIHHEAMRIDEDAKPFMKYKNPDPGFTDKIPHGFSYVGGGYDLMDKVIAGHGMHCAGIIAGNSDELKGVVPNAQIFSYRIFSDSYYGDRNELYEFGGDDAVYHAIDDAVKNGADVISMSIGQAGNGYAGDLYYETVNRAAEQGVVIVSAIGNYGSAASDNTFDNNPTYNMEITDFSAMTYYAGIGRMLAVGAATNTHRQARMIQIGDKKFAYATLGSYNSNKKSMDNNSGPSEFVFVGHGRESAYKSLAKQGISVEDKVVVALRDGARNKGSKVVEKVETASLYGAKGIILLNAPIAYSRDVYMEYPITSYENDPQISEIIENEDMWAISLNGTDGEVLKKLIKEGTLEVAFPDEEKEVPLAKNIRVSGFSGWGPNAELELKPEVIAPGENIYSSMNRNRYGYMSGTSMATPHVAGISAMLVQKVKSIIGKPYFNQMKQADVNKILLMNTAEPVNDYIKTDLVVSPRRQGAGMVRADKAVKNEVLITNNKKGAVELKDFEEDTKVFKLRLDNLSNEDKEYQVRFSDVIGQGVTEQEKLILNADKIKTGEFTDSFDIGKVKVSVPEKLEDASISSDKQMIRVPKNSYVEMEVSLNTVGKEEGYFVEGYVYFDSKEESSYPSLSIPYLGFRGDWQDGPIIDKPMWDESSIYKHTTVVGLLATDHGDDIKYKILGVDKNAYPTVEIEEYGYKHKVADTEHLKEGYKVDPEKISFSVGKGAYRPNEVTLRMVALREVKDLEVAILNDKKEVVRVVNRSHNYRKQINNVIYESDWQAKVYHRPNILFKWDGKIYNPKKSKDSYAEYGDGMVGAPSGQYYYRIRAKVKDTDNYEETLLPVKLDNTSPKYGIEDIKYTFNTDGKTRDVNFSITDDTGIMFVGASLDNKPVEVEKVDGTHYVIKNLKINELTKSRLHIEAMDYATNLMEPIEIDLNSKFIELENYAEVLAGESTLLKVHLENETIDKIQAYQEGRELGVSRDRETFEIKLEGKEPVVIIGKDIVGNIIGEDSILLYQAKPISDHSHSKKFGPIDYGEMDDEESAAFRQDFDYGMMNYYILGQSSKLIEHDDNQNYFNPSDGWYIDFYNGEYDLSDYKIKMTVYNTLHQDYKPTFEAEWNADDVPYEPNIPVFDGTNIVNLTVLDKNDPNKIVFSRGILVMYDSQAPELVLDNANAYDDEEKIYANSERLLISGIVKDNLDEVYLDLNGDNVVTTLKQGDFAGNTEGRFEAVIKVEDGDCITFKGSDRFGNIMIRQYFVVMDQEKPTIEIDEESLNEDSILEPMIKDNKGVRETIILVNGKPYEEGSRLGQYGINGKYNIEITAIDKAGNVTQKTIEMGLTDEDKIIDGVTLKQDTFTKDEIKSFEDFVNLPEGIEIIRVSEINPELDEQEVVVTVQNAFGIQQDLSFRIKIRENQEPEIEEEMEDIKLKKVNFLPEELTSVEALFDLPEGVTVKMDPIDASTIGEKEITVVFIKGQLQKTVTYKINILPELTVKLKNTRIALKDLRNINNLVEEDSRFRYRYKYLPTYETGTQTIIIVIEDDYGNVKEEYYIIEVYEEDDTPNPTPNPNPGPQPRPNPRPRPDHRPSQPKKKVESSIEEPKYNPVGETKEEYYKINNTISSSKTFVVMDIANHWAKDVIERAIKDEIVSGYPDGTFKPDNTTSRSEFVALANRLFKLESKKALEFADVKNDAWYYKELQALVEHGMIKGDETNHFNPSSSITKQEVLNIFVRYIEKYKPELLNMEMKDLPFMDVDGISPWARDGIVKAYSLGLVKGDENNRLGAKNKATRAEVIQMIYNLKALLDKEI